MNVSPKGDGLDASMKRALLILSSVIFLLACGPREKLEEVNYRLKWLYNVSTVGDLYAEAQGYFVRSGLKVNVKPGGPERDALKELELGHAQFGVASADQVLRAAAKGSPIVVLAQLFQVKFLPHHECSHGGNGSRKRPRTICFTPLTPNLASAAWTS